MDSKQVGVNMLAGQNPHKGFKYNFKVLLNGWVIALFILCFGRLFDFIGTFLWADAFGVIGLCIGTVGWIIGGAFSIIFVIRLIAFALARRAGKIL